MAQLTRNSLFQVEVIFTYYEGPQQAVHIRAVMPPTAAALRSIALKACPGEVGNLIKLSCCVAAPEGVPAEAFNTFFESRALRWFRENNGKFYFNPEVNTDQETERNRAARDSFQPDTVAPVEIERVFHDINVFLAYVQLVPVRASKAEAFHEAQQSVMGQYIEEADRQMEAGNVGAAARYVHLAQVVLG